METIAMAASANGKPRPPDDELGFGRYTTDHMFLMDYVKGRGWRDARVEPYHDLSLDPTAMVLHYNQQVFEGLKAHSLADGGVALFRPDRHIERMNVSARRLVMPELDPEVFLLGMKQLISVDRDWLPQSPGTSFYLRPTMIANEPALGVRASDTYLFYIVISPVGAYYPQGFDPTRIFVVDDCVRAVPGGVGEAKTSGNYAPTLRVYEEAAGKGYTQVLWLDARGLRYVEEIGNSNSFFVFDDELVTPPLNGTILRGVIRDSVLQLARHWGLSVSERPVTIDEVVEGCRSGRLVEMFASGTAAVISPVGEICYKKEDLQIADGQTGALAKRLHDEITAIQHGRSEDIFGWLERID